MVDERYLRRPISEVGAKVESRVPTTGTNTFNPGWREFGFLRVEVACHPNVANLGVLKFGLAVRALKNPSRHVAPARWTLIG